MKENAVVIIGRHYSAYKHPERDEVRIVWRLNDSLHAVVKLIDGRVRSLKYWFTSKEFPLSSVTERWSTVPVPQATQARAARKAIFWAMENGFKY